MSYISFFFYLVGNQERAPKNTHFRKPLHTPIGIHIENSAIIGKGRHRKSRVHVARGWQTLPLTGTNI